MASLLPWRRRRERIETEVASRVRLELAQQYRIWPEFQHESDWARGASLPTGDEAMGTTAVYTCVAVIAEEISRIRPYHLEHGPTIGKQRLQSDVQAMLDKPNPYQSRVDFWLAMAASQCLRGNAYAIGRWQGRSQSPVEMHFLHPSTVQPYVGRDGVPFYKVTVTEESPLLTFMEPGQSDVPAREMLHWRMFTGPNPLVGITPLRAIRFPVAHGEAIQRSGWRFFSRQSRPDGLLSTDQPLDSVAVDRLQKQWKTFSGGDNVGGTAVLDRGLKWTALSLTAEESQLVEQYKLTLSDAARIYRVPPWLVGLDDRATFNNVETWARMFYVQTLSWYLESLEAALPSFLRLPAGQEAEFDVESVLLRSEFKTRMEGLEVGVRGGIITINEARRAEGRPPVPGGDQVLVQQQMTPIDQLREVHAPRPAPTPQPPAPDPDPPDPPAARPNGEDAEAAALLRTTAELAETRGRALSESQREAARIRDELDAARTEREDADRRLQAAKLERMELASELGAARARLAQLEQGAA